MELILKPLNVFDSETLLSFAKASFINTYAHLNTPENMAIYLENNFTIEKIKTELADTKNIFTGIFLNDTLVGYTKLRSNNYDNIEQNKSALELERIYVAKNLQGLKIGQKLIEQCLAYSQKNNYSELWLGVWEHNEKAIAFYKKMGFEIFSSHIFLLGTDEQNDLLMRIKI